MRISFLCSASMASVMSTAAVAEGDFPATLAGHGAGRAELDAPAAFDVAAEKFTRGENCFAAIAKSSASTR